ncbi:MAG: TolC family protein [Pirellulaceae bacterium]
MRRQNQQAIGILLLGAILCTGCYPTQPFYFRESSDLSMYLDKATEMEYPDVHEAHLEEVANTQEPYTLSDPFEMEADRIWDLTLEEAVAISLKNSKAIRTVGGNAAFRVIPNTTLTSDALPPNLINRNDAAPTIYDQALVSSDPQFGVEAALSEFDAQFNFNANFDRQDRPQNFTTGSPFFLSEFQQTLGVVTAELTKRSATGTQWFLRQGTVYDANNRGGLIYPSSYQATVEMEARHPLLRGSGVQVNRVNVLLARIREDVALADFEANIRNLTGDVEQAYWQLYFAYHNLEASKTGRDSALVTWRRVHQLMINGAEGGEAEKEAQARQQYFEFRSRTQAALRDLYKAEASLRYFLGLSANDGRLIRPIEEPTDAWVRFEWFDIHEEALMRAPELRRQKWRIKQRETELITARNQLLPQLDVVGLYRFMGLGDDLITTPRDGRNFNQPGSYAWDELTEGRYQEWSMGLQFSTPIGFRRELAGMRNAQLRIAREKAVLEDMELEISHLLTDAVRDLDANYNLVQTNLNRLIAANREVEAVQAAYEAGTVTLDQLLDAQRRRADTQIAYFQSLIEYNIAIKDIHLRKGTLLEFNGVYLAEGPWPEKAYFDAKGHARRRAASRHLDYGYTRPAVISQGPGHHHGVMSHGPMHGETIIYEGTEGEEIQTPRPPTPARATSGQPTPAKAPHGSTTQRSPAPKSLDLEELGLTSLVSEVRGQGRQAEPLPTNAQLAPAKKRSLTPTTSQPVLRTPPSQAARARSGSANSSPSKPKLAPVTTADASQWKAKR